MDIRRVALYAALAFIVYSLWTNWQHDYPVNQGTSVSAENKTVVNTGKHLLPVLNDTGNDQANETINPSAQSTSVKAEQMISVKTDVLSLLIDTNNGDIVDAKLLDYPVSVDEQNTPITILNDDGNKRYVANSSLLDNSGSTVENINLNFQTEQTSYQLDPNQKQLTVVLKGHNEKGLEVTKTFTFERGSYLIAVDYQIKNAGDANWKGYMNTQLLRGNPEEDKSSMFHVGSFTGASYSSPGKHRYQKVSFKDMTKTDLNTEVQGGWVAMQQHYFLSAWIPPADSKNVFYTRTQNDDYSIGAVSRQLVLKPGDTTSLAANLYVGPEITSQLKEIAPGLDLTVDYGWLWFLSSLLFSFMKAIHSVVGNWGWSIVLVTVLIKLAFYRLSASSYKSMAGMRKLQPKLQALRERYGDDKAKMSQATMELYREEKINPLGGCLPILVQIPVFIALYWVLLESVELRQAPFIFWIKDLAAADPYHVLPVIMGFTMLIQQRLNPAPPDPMQAKVMMFLPILFTGLFWNFPAGLVLYWIVNNTLSILQQWYITRKYSDSKPEGKKLSTVK